MASELDELEDDFMLKNYLSSLNNSYYGGPGFALPDSRGGSKEPINILVDNIPSALNREGLIRAFRFANVFPINCKIFKTNCDRQKAIVQVKTTTEAASAIQAFHLKEPLDLKITLAANKGELERKKEEIRREQQKELAKHLSGLIKPNNDMGDFVNSLLAVENLVKILPSTQADCSACEADPLVRHVHFIASDETIFDPFEGLPAKVPVSCAYCSNNEGKFFFCSACRAVAYCGLRCQVLAWAHHRKVCSSPPKFTNGTSDKKPDKKIEKIPEKISEKIPEKISEKIPEKAREKSPVKDVKKTKEIILNPKPNEQKDNPGPIHINTGFVMHESVKVTKPKQKISLNQYHHTEPAQHNYEKEIDNYVPKISRSFDRTEIKIENNHRINDTVTETRYPKSNQPIDPVSPPRPTVRPNKIVSPSEALEISRKVCPANFYHLYKMVPFNCNEPVLLYKDPNDSSIVYALGDNESMLALYDVLSLTDDSCPKIKPAPGKFGIARVDEDDDFYRVLVLEMLEGGKKCRCFFTDYGNQGEIDCSSIYEIPDEISFEKIPAQAVRCRVDNADDISDYEDKIEYAIAEGKTIEAKITRTISPHEYAIQIKI